MNKFIEHYIRCMSHDADKLVELLSYLHESQLETAISILDSTVQYKGCRFDTVESKDKRTMYKWLSLNPLTDEIQCIRCDRQYENYYFINEESKLSANADNILSMVKEGNASITKSSIHNVYGILYGEYLTKGYNTEMKYDKWVELENIELSEMH